MGALVGLAFASLARAAVFAAQALVAAIIAAIALCLAVVGAVAALLSFAFRGLAAYAMAIVMAACVAVAIAGVVLAFGPLVEAFGGDVAALLPAGALVLSPIAFVMLARLGFGGLALAGAVTIGMGYLFPVLSPVARVLFVMLPIGAAFFQSTQQGRVSHVRQVEREVE